MREPVHGMQEPLEKHKTKASAFPLRRAALTRKTRYGMRRSRILQARAKSSAAEGEALQGYI
jgi:hypothetical protein